MRVRQESKGEEVAATVATVNRSVSLLICRHIYQWVCQWVWLRFISLDSIRGSVIQNM